jgi:hypothetical protein
MGTAKRGPNQRGAASARAAQYMNRAREASTGLACPSTSRTPETPAQWGGQAGPEPPGKGTAVYGVRLGEVNGQSVISVISSERRIELIGEGGPESSQGTPKD